MTNEEIIPKFNLGQTVVTRNAHDKIDPIAIYNSLLSHSCGDWGTVCHDDWKTNDEALELGNRILSSYEDDGQVFWIITEWDRSVTTVLLPDDY